MLRPRRMSPLQAALRSSALVMAVAFPHHAVQEITASKGPAEWPDTMCRLKDGKRSGGE
jgi:hypothetical protein